MRIAIFNHPFSDFYTSKMRLNRATLFYLSEIINKHITLTFDVVKQNVSKIELPIELIYLNDYLKNDYTHYSFFNQYYQFGKIDNFNHKELKKFQPELFLITSFAFCYFDGFNKMVNYLKKLYPNIPIVCGGAGPSSYPEYYLQHSSADYVVVGAAELSLINLIDYIEKKSNSLPSNVYSRNNEKTIHEEKKYFFNPFISFSKKKQKFVQLQLTRGCPKKCSYCSVHLTSGKYFLKAALDDIQREIDKIPHHSNITFDFEDDNISHNKKYFLQVLHIIKQKFNDAQFTAENGLDFTTLDEEFIEKLVTMGFKQFNLSLTSINNNILKEIGRNYTIKRFEEVLACIKKFNIQTIVYFISGLPGDTVKNILNSLFFLAKKKVLIGVSTFYPVPNTPIIKMINKKILPILSKGSSFYNWGNLSTKELVSVFMFSRFINQINFITQPEWDNFFYTIKNLDLKINKGFVVCNAILSKKIITKIGIALSLQRKKIVAITKSEKNLFTIQEYPLDNTMTRIFFEFLEKNILFSSSVEKQIITFFNNDSPLQKNLYTTNKYKPFVSVIIPVFNRLAFLKNAVISVINQTYSNWELIIIDDGSLSTENYNFVNSLNDKRIRYYKNDKNYGVSYSRNRGILLAKYDYIAFLDSDDKWLENKLQKQIDFFIKKPKINVVHTEEKWIRNGQPINQKNHHKKRGGDIFLDSLHLCLMSPSSIMIKKNIFDKYGMFDENLIVCEDYDMWLRISAFEKVGFIDEVLIIKNGGHTDQLSKTYEAMDKYRVESLVKIIKLEDLSTNKKEAIKKVIIKKSKILLNGAIKRGLKDKIDLYKKWLSKFTNQ